MRLLRDRLSPIAAHRLRMLWFLPGYWRLLPNVRLIADFMRIDWTVLHSHRPVEISYVVRAIHDHPGTVVDAGCWNGGSTAKFSLACALYGSELHVYDSFQASSRSTKAATTSPASTRRRSTMCAATSPGTATSAFARSIQDGSQARCREIFRRK